LCIMMASVRPPRRSSASTRSPAKVVGIAYLVKQYLPLHLPGKIQTAFYQVVQALADPEAREMTVDDITTAFRSTYHFGSGTYGGRLILRSFKLSSVLDSELA